MVGVISFATRKQLTTLVLSAQAVAAERTAAAAIIEGAEPLACARHAFSKGAAPVMTVNGGTTLTGLRDSGKYQVYWLHARMRHCTFWNEGRFTCATRILLHLKVVMSACHYAAGHLSLSTNQTHL